MAGDVDPEAVAGCLGGCGCLSVITLAAGSVCVIFCAGIIHVVKAWF